MKAILGEFWIRHKITSFAQTKCGWWSRDHFNPYKLCGFNVSEMLKNCLLSLSIEYIIPVSGIVNIYTRRCSFSFYSDYILTISDYF